MTDMAAEQDRCCKTCRHRVGCLIKGTAIFSLYIQTGRDQELRHVQNDLDKHLGCPNWEAEKA